MKTLLSSILLAALLGGCAVHTPVGGVVLDPNGSLGGHEHHHEGGTGGGFCPPGQAKKGRC